MYTQRGLISMRLQYLFITRLALRLLCISRVCCYIYIYIYVYLCVRTYHVRNNYVT